MINIARHEAILIAGMDCNIAMQKFCQYAPITSKSENIRETKETNPEDCNCKTIALKAETKPADEDANIIANKIIFFAAKIRSSLRSLFIIFKYNSGDGFVLSFDIILRIYHLYEKMLYLVACPSSGKDFLRILAIVLRYRLFIVFMDSAIFCDISLKLIPWV